MIFVHCFTLIITKECAFINSNHVFYFLSFLTIVRRLFRLNRWFSIYHFTRVEHRTIYTYGFFYHLYPSYTNTVLSVIVLSIETWAIYHMRLQFGVIAGVINTQEIIKLQIWFFPTYLFFKSHVSDANVFLRRNWM